MKKHSIYIVSFLLLLGLGGSMPANAQKKKSKKPKTTKVNKASLLIDVNFKVYFASQKPLRTVIADRNMNIKVGVAIGGKREVDTKDWAEFRILPNLLEGTGLELLPESYYKLSDESRFYVSKPTLAVADVQIDFTEDFYNDPKAVSTHYALPFKVVASSHDGVLEGKEYSIVAIKYISKYHGTYYVKGKVSTLDNAGNVIQTEDYAVSDLSKNITRNLTTVGRYSVSRTGVANRPVDAANEKVKLTFNDDNTVTVETADGGIAISNGSGTYNYDESTFDMTVNLNYEYELSGTKYKVEETLIRRQDPLKDLRFEEWN